MACHKQKVEYSGQNCIWNKTDDLKCPLCNSLKDNHNHLFFGCDFSSSLEFFKGLMKLDHVPDDLYLIIDYISSRPISKSIWSIIQRLVLVASVYYIWIERNTRIFQKKLRSVDEICSIIRDYVRLRLLSLKIKSSKQTLEAAGIWNFHVMPSNMVKGSKIKC